MCGITGYIGNKEALPIAFHNLRKLEYRGYDSAGVVYFENRGGTPTIKLIRKTGKLDQLEGAIFGKNSLPGTVAIAHTRWATHGAPTEKNAHPHADCGKQIFVVHNGIIENYEDLKIGLIKSGHKFRSETDTEIVAHLLEEERKDSKTFDEALSAALQKIRGAYALGIVVSDEPNTIYFARLGSPLVLGLGEGEYFLASDPTALAGLVKRVVYLDDGQRGRINREGFWVSPTPSKIEALDLSVEEAKKGSFPHFMLKEIFEGPEVVRSAFRGRLLVHEGGVRLGGLSSVVNELARIKRLEIVGCGTSYYAGMIGKMFMEELAQIPTSVNLASEYRYHKNPPERGTAAVFVSQSGETADTLAAFRKAKARKYLTLGIVNVVGSSIARETDAGVYNHAGPEIGVASTKAFLSQVGVLALMSLRLAKEDKNFKKITAALDSIPKKIELILKQNGAIKALAKKYSRYNNFLYIGRGYNYPVALEGALKLKEISYAHAEGYAAGEMKHGPIALIDKNFPTIAIATDNKLQEKMMSNLQEIKARGGPVVAIATAGDKNVSRVADEVIYVPKTLPQLEPLLTVVPLQLFAYHFAVMRGNDVDKPRNLAKSVTVE
jgi:glucosamine--fructose-6-phosphate aminotransferase (isomerizing)